MKALIGRKVGMTQVIQDDGIATGVTLIQAGPCTVTQVKSQEIDGYDAVQLAYGEAKANNKPQAGHLKKAKVTPEIMREFRLNEQEATEIGSSFNAEVFTVGDMVTVSGTSKGKGFAGTIKRHNFSRGPKTHGSRNYREPGSIGSMYPQKIFKGKKMAGQMGGDQVTVKNLKVALVDAEKNLIGVVGAVPGPRKSLVTIEGQA